MANYSEIMSLVEEVRDILGGEEVLDEAKGASKHNPFRWVKKGKSIGVGPRKRTMKKRGYWKCKCSSYSCNCRAVEGPDKGTKKKVRIDRAYKTKYNKQYAKFRKKHASRYAPGKASVFKKRPKAG